MGTITAHDENVDDAVQHAERLMHYARIQKNTVITERQPEPHAPSRAPSHTWITSLSRSSWNRFVIAQAPFAGSICG